mmetsp:Transcript_79155/g.235855  ORF Transcript_79155/g.235855 Transcript_79155/m.235855 type:complete len:245 (+) Transcript_79155:202-936(+)
MTSSPGCSASIRVSSEWGGLNAAKATTTGMGAFDEADEARLVPAPEGARETVREAAREVTELAREAARVPAASLPLSLSLARRRRWSLNFFRSAAAAASRCLCRDSGPHGSSTSCRPRCSRISRSKICSRRETVSGLSLSAGSAGSSPSGEKPSRAPLSSRSSPSDTLTCSRYLRPRRSSASISEMRRPCLEREGGSRSSSTRPSATMALKPSARSFSSLRCDPSAAARRAKRPSTLSHSASAC